MPLDRRTWLRLTAGGIAGLATAPGRLRAKDPEQRKQGKPTFFEIACMTLPYSRFPLRRALQGIQHAGYQFVALGTTHPDESGHPAPILAPEDGVGKAMDLGKLCRGNYGLLPLTMFSGIYPEDPKAMEVLTARIKQAKAAGIPQVLTFGHTKGGNRKLWVERFKTLGPIARDHGVMIVVKQHGGETGTGTACAEIIREVDDEGVKVNYDAGNVMDYLDVDPIPTSASVPTRSAASASRTIATFRRTRTAGPGSARSTITSCSTR